MSPISTRKTTTICKRRKLNDDALLVRLDENKIKQYERTHSNSSDISSDGLLSLENSSECSSSNADEMSFANCSSRDLCIFVLSSHGLLLNRIEDTDKGIIGSQNKMRSLKCKSCASVGQSTKMLICDKCEGPFHLKCSGMLLRKALPEEWYCHPCSRNKRRRKSGKSSLESKNFMRRSKQLIEEKISKYTSSVRIGEAFQADVQEWFGPIHDDDDYHEKLEEIRPEKHRYLNVRDMAMDMFRRATKLTLIAIGYNVERRSRELFVESGDGLLSLRFKQIIGTAHVLFNGIHRMRIVQFLRNWKQVKS